MQVINFEEVVGNIVARDGRYHCDAYLFVRDALEFTQKMRGKGKRTELRHVNGQQLLEGIREYALELYGPMTLTVLSEWRVRGCEDFGEIVFAMVEAGLLAKTPEDTRDDFKGVFDFDIAFRQPFLPKRKSLAPAALQSRRA